MGELYVARVRGYTVVQHENIARGLLVERTGIRLLIRSLLQLSVIDRLGNKLQVWLMLL